MTAPDIEKTGSPASELSPKFPLMGLLYFEPLHGYELHRRLESSLGEVWRIRQSQAYSSLKRMENEGLVTSTRLAQEKRPDRACFSLTPAGKGAFETWLNTPTPGTARAMRVEFVARLFFASQLGTEACTRMLADQARATGQDLERLQRRLSGLPAEQVFNRLGLELRVRQLATTLEWLESCKQNP